MCFGAALAAKEIYYCEKISGALSLIEKMSSGDFVTKLYLLLPKLLQNPQGWEHGVVKCSSLQRDALYIEH